MSLCLQCGSPLADGAQCGVCGFVPADDLTRFPSAPVAPLTPTQPLPPGRMAGMQNLTTAVHGPVSVVESHWEQYLIRFANGRREWVPGCGFRASGVGPYGVGAQGLVRFADGVDYVGQVAGVHPGRHRVRTADGREVWVADDELIVGPVAPFGGLPR